MPRVKWLNKLEDKEDLGILTRFKEYYIKSYYEVVIIRYFLINKPYILI
jgi:hypothetical protein